jgi:transcriptional regulator with XRE-family HTH domain
VAVRKTREAFEESQASFAQRVGLSGMTVSKFERGEKVPRDPAVLQALSRAAEEVNLDTETEQFATACREALAIETVNRMYPGRQFAAAHSSLAINFQTLPEWRLLAVALFAVRYDSATAQAMESAGGPICAIVDEVLSNADSSRGIGPDFFRDLEARVKTLMDKRSLKSISRTIQDQEAR